MPTVLRIGCQSKSQTALPLAADLDTRVALIQALIPLGLQAVEDVLQQEVELLAGPRYARRDGAPPWSAGAGSAGPSTWRTRNSPSRCPASPGRDRGALATRRLECPLGGSRKSSHVSGVSMLLAIIAGIPQGLNSH